jgi:hypothetical protein
MLSWSKAPKANPAEPEDVTEADHRDLERLGRRAAAASQLQDVLTDLRSRMARKSKLRAGSVSENRVVPESPTKAA